VADFKMIACGATVLMFIGAMACAAMHLIARGIDEMDNHDDWNDHV